MAVKLIGAACSSGGIHRGCRHGPSVFQRHGMPLLKAKNAQWHDTIFETAYFHNETQPVVLNYCRRIRTSVRDVMKQGDFPVVIGGDHSCAMGTWMGVTDHVAGPIGMIWIDAHMDSHTPWSSHSGRMHGMPVACLLGQSSEYFRKFNNGRAAFNAEHSFLLGVRSFEKEEPQLLDALNVPYFTSQDIGRMGLQQAVDHALGRVASCPNGFGISIDLDALDPKDAPGVAVPEPHGMLAKALVKGLKNIVYKHRLRAVEIAEYNPAMDHGFKTARLVSQLLNAIL